MSWSGVFKEFLSRPREVHALVAGFIFAYLGYFHQPLLPYAGFEVMTPLAFGIGLMIIGVTPVAIRKVLNGVLLPEEVDLPEDIRVEWIYYWGGVFLVYLIPHVLSFF